MRYKVFTSESVAEGHPDKICDQISDAVLDEALKVYPPSRVAVETLVTKNHVVMAGEVTCPKKLPFEKIARSIIKDIGYTEDIYNFSFHSPISVFIHEQSPDIARGVNNKGAGDQGMMFGYATNETKELMPLPIILSHGLVKTMDNARKNKKISYLRPDGKSEVKVAYQNGKPLSVQKVILAVPYDPKIDKTRLKKDLFKFVVKPILTKYHFSIDPKDLIVNGTGRWEIGGPASDTGVTGRKIMVDTYGAMARQGGGCFSGKDPTKVDRTGAYASRFIAKNIVAHKLSERCEVQLAYVIGHSDPVGKAIETFNSHQQDLEKIEKFAWGLIDLSVAGIIKALKLQRPIYRKTARYGAFGNPNYPWEKITP